MRKKFCNNFLSQIVEFIEIFLYIFNTTDLILAVVFVAQLFLPDIVEDKNKIFYPGLNWYNTIMKLFSDPLIIVAIVIGTISLVLVILLVQYYRKLKDQKVISDVMKMTDDRTNGYETKRDRQEPSPAPPPSPSINTDIIIAQLNELSSQISSLNSHTKELTEIVKTLSGTQLQMQNQPQQVADGGGLAEKQLEKLVKVLQQVETIVMASAKFTQVSTQTLSQVNAKLDNISKILNTILQQ